MSYELKLAIGWYLVSCVPWALSYRFKERDAQWGLFLIDGTFTVVSYIYFARAIGWWTLVFVFAMMGVGKLIYAAFGKGYDNLIDP